ncbi:MAG: hypothetical protein WA691_00030 [Thermoplasmata archaeon]
MMEIGGLLLGIGFAGNVYFLFESVSPVIMWVDFTGTSVGFLVLFWGFFSRDLPKNNPDVKPN